MSRELVPVVTPDLALLAPLVERAEHYAADARASSTRRAYAIDFRTFQAWCDEKGLCALPTTPATVAVYLAALADQGRKPSTINKALTSIAHAHRAAGYEWQKAHPAITKVMSGIRRSLGVAPVQKAPVRDEELERLLLTLRHGASGLRDRALLTLGWFGAFRRSELVSLHVRDVADTREGLIVTLRRSKNDQEGKGFSKGIPYASAPALCPVRALRAWLEFAGITEGALFRAIDAQGRISEEALCDRSVARIVQRSAAAAGLDPATLGGHSLRAGFATTAGKKGKSLDAIMRHTGHKSETVARSYIRHATLFDDNAATGLV